MVTTGERNMSNFAMSLSHTSDKAQLSSLQLPLQPTYLSQSSFRKQTKSAPDQCQALIFKDRLMCSSTAGL